MSIAAPELDAPPAEDLARFAEVDAWVFDLDNTLYPRSSGLWLQIDDRIRDYVRRLLSVSADEAQILQKGYYERYGATLRGLMLEHNVEPDEFLEYVHDIDRSALKPDPALAAAIADLPGRRFILTNGSRRHAERIAESLGITGHFDDIFDIVWAQHLPKPSREVYDRLIAETGADPRRTAMFEDLARNLLVPQQLGMATVLVVPPGTRAVFKGDWDMERTSAAADKGRPAADFVTDDLSGFLLSVTAALRARASR